MTFEYAYGFGLVNSDKDGNTLDAWFPNPRLGKLPKALNSRQQEELTKLEVGRKYCKIRLVTREVAQVEANLTEPPVSTEDAYLRLHLLSHRLVKPNSINLEGIFGLLPNIIWTPLGPCPAGTFNEANLRSMEIKGRPLQVLGVDKFPQMLNYVVPSGVRIADASRVRLGAYLAEGTTVMPAGFVNFNAGTLGAAMVEGRVSQGVVIGDGSDIGGGASTMGTLSGGGTERVSIGKNCLLGAEAGIGIALGDNCLVEAGLYITAGTKVALLSSDGREPQIVKARKLSGISDVIFRRNSQNGRVEALPRGNTSIKLNHVLHSHN